ncbi:MAG: toll/interleukin-1 receptor domain-containing protein [Streptomyces sp.]|nr:toll/interleukin-1 receptor domain-containing protein [Streptomyces sp.]
MTVAAGPTVFLSYSRDDQQTAVRLAAELRRLGADVWLDVDNLLPGDNWKSAVSDAIERSDYFVALLSASSVGKRGYVQRELREALDVLDETPDDQRFVIPCRIDDCTIPRRLRDRNAVDLFPYWDNGLARLAKLFHSFGPAADIGCALCGDGEHVDQRRLTAMLEFGYLFTRLDQLGSGAWGRSVAGWMTEVGKERASFELHSAIGVEGGIETTTICCQGLARVWTGVDGPVAATPWATRSREYFRARQSSRDGSIGYLRNAFRDATPLIESTCRHTAQAALALAELRRCNTVLVDALQYALERLVGSDGWNAVTLASNAVREDRYPGMVLAATLSASRSCERNAVDEPGAGWPRPLPPGADLEMLGALARIDPEHYPFFRPYGSLDRMRWYSFLAVVDLVCDRELAFLGDRVRDGVSTLLEAVDDDGGLGFWAGAGSADFALVALMLSVLYAEPVLKVLDSHTRSSALEIRARSLRWLVANVDRYLDEPGLFGYVVSGNMSRLLVFPACRRAPWTSVRLRELDVVADRVREAFSAGEREMAGRILAAELGRYGVDTAALIALLGDKVID